MKVLAASQSVGNGRHVQPQTHLMNRGMLDNRKKKLPTNFSEIADLTSYPQLLATSVVYVYRFSANYYQ